MTCPACGGTLAAWRTVPGSEPALAHIHYELRRCTVCGTGVTVAPAPGSTGATGRTGDLHESGAYRPGTPRLYRAALPLLRTFDRRRLGLLRRIAAPPARVLDAGAGQGRFVTAARAAGYDAFGIEPAQRGLERARALGAPIHPVSIEAAEIAAGSLDAVTLWHVLEHVADPGAALERIARWLRPGGGLLVGVPNVASVQARVGGERWYHLDVPRHRTHFTPPGLTRLLERSGLAPVAVHHLLLEHNPYGMWQSAVNRLTRDPSYVYNVLKRNAPTVSRDLAISALALPLAPLAAAAELAAGMAGRGGSVAVLARRPPRA
ncbi:MAG TPA: class I SAM-dependent methyltransferase [Solirubrobacteraceae bacterium]|nr:class I SAM-dependent methyltransferase [Solirubrobacteraceae bacterium]